MPLFPSEEWVEAWVTLANGSAEFEASGAGWEGAVGIVIEADPRSGVPETLYIRLDGRSGKWLGHALGTSSGILETTVFVLRAPYVRWKQLVRQELHPIKGLLQGRIRIEGHLPVILRWIASIGILAKLAGEVDTEFVDELAPGAGSRAARDGT
jgi:putative sterol carrier protein